ELPPSLIERGLELQAGLERRLNGSAESSALPVASAVEPTVLAGEEADLSPNACWHISVRFGPDVLRNGMDPLSILRYLKTLGEIVHIETLADALPAAEAMDPETCYLGVEIAFRCDRSRCDIESAFEFVREDCSLRILPPNSAVDQYLDLIES